MSGRIADMRVVVIGAGAFGSWTALWLLRRGASVMLVDQYGPGNALSSSGDESRVTRSAHGPDDHYPRWQRRALAQWRELDPSLVVPAGVTWFAGAEDGFEAQSLEVLGRLGIPAERVEVAEAARRWPQISMDGVAWVLHEPEAAALLARRGVAATVAAFVAEGGELRPPARRWTRRGWRWRSTARRPRSTPSSSRPARGCRSCSAAWRSTWP